MSSQSLLDFWGVITESKRIINAHSRHFLALSVLFLLPLSFSITVLPTLFSTFTTPQPNHIVSLLRFNHNHSSLPFYHHHHHHHHHQYNHLLRRLTQDHKTLTFSLLFSAFVLLLSLSAVGSITYSVLHGFYGRPVKLASAVKSILYSFLPLLATCVAAQIVILLVFALFGAFSYLGTKGFELILGEGYYNSPYFIGVSLIWAVLLGLALVYVSVNWYLMNVVVVVESKWGFQPMMRSQGLVRGMRWVALSLIMFFGFFASVLLWISMVSGDLNDGRWNTWAFILRTVATCAALTLILLHSVAASTVLYMYCKALHGELAGEIANEFAAEYVSLPFDDKKQPHIVFYVQ